MASLGKIALTHNVSKLRGEIQNIWPKINPPQWYPLQNHWAHQSIISIFAEQGHKELFQITFDRQCWSLRNLPMSRLIKSTIMCYCQPFIWHLSLCVFVLTNSTIHFAMQTLPSFTKIPFSSQGKTAPGSFKGQSCMKKLVQPSAYHNNLLNQVHTLCYLQILFHVSMYPYYTADF